MGAVLDHDHWLICPAQQLDKPENQWVYRVLELYRHYSKGNLSCWIPNASEALSRALVAVDNAVQELKDYYQEKAERDAKRGK